MESYLIPANSKKSLLIFGVFNTEDFILAGVGMGITLFMLLVLPIQTIGFALAALAPALVSCFLVFPIPNYHNMLTILKNVFNFYTTNQKLIWKGWCVLDGNTTK